MILSTTLFLTRAIPLYERYGFTPAPEGPQDLFWGYPMSDEPVFGAVAARTGSLHDGAYARTPTSMKSNAAWTPLSATERGAAS